MRYIFTIMVALLLTACASVSSIPKPEKSEYFTTLGGGFVTTRGNPPTQKYGVNLVITKDLPENAYAVVEFENPADRTNAIMIEGSVEEIKKMMPSAFPNVMVLTSPVVHGVSRHTNYAVIVSIYSDSSKNSLAARHTQRVNSGHIHN
jgi:hypothetical protein